MAVSQWSQIHSAMSHLIQPSNRRNRLHFLMFVRRQDSIDAIFQQYSSIKTTPRSSSRPVRRFFCWLPFSTTRPGQKNKSRAQKLMLKRLSICWSACWPVDIYYIMADPRLVKVSQSRLLSRFYRTSICKVCAFLISSDSNSALVAPSFQLG